MTIAAILDIDKSIETFKNRIQTLLLVEDLSNWDGTKLQEKEQEIRNTSLELAGQCIALLLSSLSQDPLAEKEANQRTQESRDVGSQSQGKKLIKIKTVGNVEVSLSVNYILNRRTKKTKPGRKKKSVKPGQRGKATGQGYYPLLRWLGMEERVSPMVWSTVAMFGMMSSSFATACKHLQEWGISLSEQRIGRLTYCFGRAGVELTEQWMSQMEEGQLPAGETLRGQRVGLNADGGRSRLRQNKKGKPKANGRRGYYGEWKEPKLFTLYAMDDEGKRINTIEIPITNDGTFGGVEVFMTLLEMYLIKLGVIHANQVLLVADGAIWIWQRIPALLKRLGLKPEQIIEVIDFYHAAEKLCEFSQLVFSNDKQAKEWFKKARSSMKNKSSIEIIKEMQKLVNDISNKKKKAAAESALPYFVDQPQRFAYREVQAMKLPIGSGAIESLIRQVVNLRLKGNGKFWLPENAELILHGRCQWAAGQWKQFSRSILTSGITSKLLPVAIFEAPIAEAA
jgi:hypothetical protein